MKKNSKYVKYIAFVFILCVTTTGNVFASCTGANKACIECSYNINMSDGTTNNVLFRVVDMGDGNVSINQAQAPDKFILDYTTNNLTGSYFINKSSKKLYCPTVYYKLVAQNTSKPDPMNPTPNNVKYNLYIGGNSNVGNSLSGSKSDGNDLKLSEISQKTKYCSFTGKWKNLTLDKEKDITVNFNINSDNVDGIKDNSGNYYLDFKNIKASDIDSNCNYKGKKLYILCQTSDSNANDPANLTHINVLNACTLSTENFFGSEEGTITKPEDAGQGNNHEGASGNNKVETDGSEGCAALEPLMDDLQFVWDVFKIAAPILVVVFGSIDFAQVVISSDNDAMKKATKKFTKRLMFAVALFFLPYFIDLLFAISGLDSTITSAVCGIN